jgi:hypothetical protein
LLGFCVPSHFGPHPAGDRTHSGDRFLFCDHGHFFFQLYDPVKICGAVLNAVRFWDDVVYSF